MSRDGARDEAARPFFALSDRTYALPILHGSADYALAVRDELLGRRYDCLAVPLPPMFREAVLDAVRDLPVVSAVVQSCGDDSAHVSYVPIDPCQPVIRALAIAQQERIPVAFVDLDLPGYHAETAIYPDAYALKVVSPFRFAAAVIAEAKAPEPGGQTDLRIRRMAFEIHKLELDHEKILFLPGLLEWPWIRDAYMRRLQYPVAPNWFEPVHTHRVAPESLYFFLCELPYITHLYQEQRARFGEDGSLSIDGVKELLIESRDRLVARKPAARKRVTVQSLRLYLQYVRNLTLIHHRFRPDLITLAQAAKQVMGDDFAISLVETAKHYPWQKVDDEPTLRMGTDMIEPPGGVASHAESRLPGETIIWRPLDLEPEPDPKKKTRWEHAWNPYTQCSWPPEDARIESFNLHVREQARNMISNDLARVEKFSSSLKDGLDIRETLRNWHTGDLYVRELPPARGNIEIVVFLFEVPADPDTYTWRTTWFAEHGEESTLCFFATNFIDEMIGPGVAQARYGGAFFLYPPRPIVDVWIDPAFRECKTLEERLLAGALAHSRERYVAVVSPCPLKATWRRLARRHGRQLIHLPLRRFSLQTIERLRVFHVLNGKQVRSYAADFIRRTD